jgi:hypothetical protein
MAGHYGFFFEGTAGHYVLTKSSGARPLILTDHGRHLDPATQRNCREQEGMSIPFVFVGKKTVSIEKSCRRHCISSEHEPWTLSEMARAGGWTNHGYWAKLGFVVRL